MEQNAHEFLVPATKKKIRLEVVFQVINNSCEEALPPSCEVPVSGSDDNGDGDPEVDEEEGLPGAKEKKNVEGNIAVSSWRDLPRSARGLLLVGKYFFGLLI